MPKIKINLPQGVVSQPAPPPAVTPPVTDDPLAALVSADPESVALPATPSPSPLAETEPCNVETSGEVAGGEPIPPVQTEQQRAEEFHRPDQPDNFSSEAVQSLKDNLQLLRDNFSNPDIVANAVRRVMQDIKQNPNFNDIMQPEDYGTMVKALRESYGVAVVTKQAKSRKKSKKSIDPELESKLDGTLDMLNSITI